MPTYEEWGELCNTDNCFWTWTTIDGVNGFKVQSKKPGYTNNLIFLPAAGLRSYDYLYDAESYGYYWSSSLDTDSPDYAYNMRFDSGSVSRHDYFRHVGQSVRPVSE